MMNIVDSFCKKMNIILKKEWCLCVREVGILCKEYQVVYGGDFRSVTLKDGSKAKCINGNWIADTQ